jgi:hypothetical protein
MPHLSPRPCALLLVLGTALLPSGCKSRPDAPPEYRTVKSTDFGKSLVLERKDAKTLQAALQLTEADLTRYFGVAPSIFRAFADSQNPRSGGATFVVDAKGGRVKGLVTAEVGDAVAHVAVAYLRADAPKEEWARLTQLPATEGVPAGPAPSAPSMTAASAAAQSRNSQGATVAQMGHVPLRTYDFPDGTGSVGLAEGWTTEARTGTRAALLKGPDGAQISVGGMYTLLNPRSTLPRGPTAVFASYGPPIEVYAAVVPQFSKLSARQGGPSRMIDHLTKVADQDNGRLSVLRYGLTETQPSGAARHYTAMAWVGVGGAPGSALLTLTLTELRAPDSTFERDKPVMFEMLHSLKENVGAVQRKSSRELAQQKQQFDAQQARMRAQQAANDVQHKQYWDKQKAVEDDRKAVAVRQNEQARGNDNVDEYVRGIRTVEDTQSGVKTSVDLGNVDKLVDTLNEKDPGRYRQIPLRDEAHPQ